MSSRSRLLAASLTVCSALVAGCGSNSGPKLEHADGAALIVLAHRIASEGGPGRANDISKLRSRTIALINARKVPAQLQEPLLSMVNAVGVKRGAAPDLEAWLHRHSH